MKHTLRLLLALLAAFSLFATACGSDSASDAVDGATDAIEDAIDGDDATDDDATDDDAMDDDAMAESDTSVGLVFDIGGRGDLSFNDSAAAGLERAHSDLGIPFSEASPNDDGSNRGELLQLAADENDIVVGVGFLFEGDAAAVAAENPDTNFAVIDSAMLNWDEGGVPYGDNVAGLTFAEEQGSFLVGAAAALKSETGMIGFIGGVCCFGLIEKFEAGYIAGAQAVNPDIEIISEYITEFPDFDGFNQPDRAQVIATTMYEDGADIIYHAAGGAGNGMFEAAKDYSEDNGSKVWGIGVDSDQYETIGAVDPSLQEYVLTSMLKRVDVAVYEVLKAQQAGNFSSGNTIYDLGVDGVGYSTSGGYVDDIADQLEDYKAQIASGAIIVPTEPGGEVTEGEPAEEAAASYGALEDCSADEGGLNIGTLLPETGALAFLGDPLVQAVRMAICDINAAGGVNGQLVTLTPGDSGTDPDIANQTVDRLIATENVNAIVGAAASGISGSVIDKITSAPVVQCSPSNTAAGLGTAGDDGYYFRTAPSDDLQAPALANVILNDGYTSVAFVPRADDWGVGLSSFFAPAFEAGGGEVVYNEPYAPESTSFDDVVADVIASAPDAVVLASFEEGLQLMRTMIEQGIGPDAVPIYITDGMAAGDLGAKVVEGTDLDPGIVQGVRGTQPSASPEAGAAFFPGAFAGYAPEVDTVFSSQSYDCTTTIALAAHAAGSNDSADIAAAMVDVTRGGEKCSAFAECIALLDEGADIDYDGASGPIDFLDVGEPSVGAYDVYEYDADGVQQVQEQLVFDAS